MKVRGQIVASALRESSAPAPFLPCLLLSGVQTVAVTRSLQLSPETAKAVEYLISSIESSAVTLNTFTSDMSC